MKTHDIYDAMSERGLTNSLRSFSKIWLGMAQNFATTNWSAALPAETAIRLRARLLNAGHADLAAVILLSLLGESENARRLLWRCRAEAAE